MPEFTALAPSCIPTLVDVIRAHAETQPRCRAYLYLRDGELEDAELTYGDLDRQARAIGSFLQREHLAGERALLLFPQGLHYLSAFLGCLYAGVIAVPTYPPRRSRSLERLEAIAVDSEAAVVLTDSSTLSDLRDTVTRTPHLGALRWIATDMASQLNGLENDWRQPDLTPDTLAFLQYTSGSTSTPKGVMITHHNLIYNQEMLRHAFDHDPQCAYVSWLPLFHDMGLIASALHALYVGAPCVLMSPVAFIQRPMRWLQAISRYEAHTSGAPNFAFDLCVERVPEGDLENLDLSSWRVAFNGAEPVRADTLDRFVERFGPCGFRPDALIPCYGLAEATVFVSASEKTKRPTLLRVDANQLEADRIVSPVSPVFQHTLANSRHDRTLVGCGRPQLAETIVIADPTEFTQVASGRVGEIWLSGPHVARGYWRREADTKAVFTAYLAGSNEGPFLRTGDLGFLHDHQLFITGRLKDLIIIRGRNYYPHDIERAAQQSHPMLRAGCGAAFTVETSNGKQQAVVLIQEVDRRFQQTQIIEAINAIRGAVYEIHDLPLYGVVLIRPGTIPKTSSGKIQRAACREGFLLDQLVMIGSSFLEPSDDTSPAEALRDLARHALRSGPISERERLLESYLTQQVARTLKVSPAKVDLHTPLPALGLDSLSSAEVSRQIAMDLGVPLSPVQLLEDVTIADLVHELAASLLLMNEGPSAAGAPLAVAHQADGTAAERQDPLIDLRQLSPAELDVLLAQLLAVRGDIR